MAQRRFQENERAVHVRRYESLRRIDRAVDVAFRREMEHSIRIELAESSVHGLAVRDIGLQKPMAWRGQDLRQSLGAPGIGQLIDGEDIVAFAHGAAYGRGANEPGASSYHQSHPPSGLRQCRPTRALHQFVEYLAF